MSKRSSKFERNERDYYKTPKEVVEPLLPHLVPGFTFIEPCAGDGSLIKHIPLKCVMASDIKPEGQGIIQKDVFDYTERDIRGAGYFITNPPWDRDILHPLILHLCKLLPTWLLFDADWMHTKQSSDYIEYCNKIVSVGRVKWMPGTQSVGFDNCAWYQFIAYNPGCRTIFYGR